MQYMYDISSVFHNRLSNSAQYPRLESDATYLYVRDEIEPNLSSKNEEMAAAYVKTGGYYVIRDVQRRWGEIGFVPVSYTHL